MKRGTFKRKATKPLRRTSLARKSKTVRVKKKLKKKGYVQPKWFKSLKPGSHGSTPAQKKLWKLTSDFVRQRDFMQYGGKCVSCDKVLSHWSEGDCAHFKAWSVSNGFFKYERKNLALSCKNCNRGADCTVGHRFGEELIRRYGKGHLEWIEKENSRTRGQKMEEWAIVERAQDIIDRQ